MGRGVGEGAGGGGDVVRPVTPRSRSDPRTSALTFKVRANVSAAAASRNAVELMCRVIRVLIHNGYFCTRLKTAFTRSRACEL